MIKEPIPVPIPPIEMTIPFLNPMADGGSSTSPVEVDKIEIYDPSNGLWGTSNKMSWEDLIFRGEPLRFIIFLKKAIDSLDDYCHDIKARTFAGLGEEENWITLTSNDYTATLSEDKKEVRVTVTYPWLVGLIPSAPEDGVAEFCSADNTAATTGKSNRYDSDKFDSEMAGKDYNRRGRARGNGNINAGIPEGKFNTQFLIAAGIMYIEVKSGNVTSEKRQIQNQADWFYISCHGSHSTGELLDASGSPVIGPNAADWDNDLYRVIIAGCSVLDIDDKNNNYGPNPSPGEAWAETGPTVFLGYCYVAPLDNQAGSAYFTADIINGYISYKFNGGKSDSEAWRDGNIDVVPQGYEDHTHPYGRPYNCCVIDRSGAQNKYWCFIGDKDSGYVWTEYNI